MKKIQTFLLVMGVVMIIATTSAGVAYAQLSSDHVADKIVMHAYGLINTTSSHGTFSFSLTNGTNIKFFPSTVNGVVSKNMNVLLSDGTVRTFVLSSSVSGTSNAEVRDDAYFAEAKAFLSAELEESNMTVKNINGSSVSLQLALNSDFQKLIDSMYGAIGTQGSVAVAPVPVSATAVAIPKGTAVTINPIASQKPIAISGVLNATKAVQTTVNFGANEKKVEINVDTMTGVSTINVGGKAATTNGTIEIKGSKLFLETNTGPTEIAISPEEAYTKSAPTATVGTIELKEEAGAVVYTLKEIKPVKILYLFPIKLQMETTIDATKGEIILVKKPWWNFLAF